MLRSIDISTSALVAQRQRMNTIAANVANAQTTRNADGEPEAYQRRRVVFSADQSHSPATRGTAVTCRVEVDQTAPPRRVYEPGHPDADGDGYVNYPAIDLIEEFVNATEAGRAYEANVAAIEISREIARMGLNILA